MLRASGKLCNDQMNGEPFWIAINFDNNEMQGECNDIKKLKMRYY